MNFTTISNLPPYRLERRKIKHVYLQYMPEEKLFRIRLPMKAGEDQLQQVLEHKKKWMMKIWQRESHRNTAPIKDRTHVDLLGKGFQLCRSTQKTWIEGEKIFFHSEAALEKLIRVFFQHVAKQCLQDQCHRLRLHEPKLAIRNMKTRWGSCNTRDYKITLNLRLVYRTQEELDYVICHELAHFRAANHGPDFYRVLQEYDPKWRIHRKKLKEPS